MTRASDPDFYQKTIRRILFLTLALGVAGAVGAAIWKGPAEAIGFLLGAVLSAASLWRWKKVVDALGSAPKGRSTMRWVLRFAALAAIAYVIVRYLGVSPAAVFLGLLVSSVAVIISIIYELVYGT